MPYIREERTNGDSTWKHVDESDHDAILAVELDCDIVWVEEPDEIIAHVEQEYATDHECLTRVRVEHGVAKVLGSPIVRQGAVAESVQNAAREYGSVQWKEFPIEVGDWGDDPSSRVALWGDFIFYSTWQKNDGRLVFDPSGADKMRKRRHTKARRRKLKGGIKHNDLHGLVNALWLLVRDHDLMGPLKMSPKGGTSTEHISAISIKFLLLIRRLYGSYDVLKSSKPLWKFLEANAPFLRATAFHAKGQKTQWLGCFLLAIWTRDRGVAGTQAKPMTRLERLRAQLEA